MMGSPAMAIAGKDLLVEMRSRQTLLLVLLTTLFITALLALGTTYGGLGWDDDDAGRAGLVSFALWVTVAISCVMAMGRAFSSEAAGDTLDGLMLCPVDRSAIFLGKMASSIAFLSIIAAEAVVLYLAFGLLDVEGPGPPLLVFLVLALGVPGLAAVSTMVSALGTHSRSRETLVLVLLVPLTLYTIILPAISATTNALLGEGPGAMQGELRIMALSDIVYIVLCYALFEHVLPE